MTVTPLQLANDYVERAYGGTLYSPGIKQINPPVIRHLPVSGQTLAYIRHALAGVVTQGTAAGAFGGFPLDKVCVAGKTGTAQLFGKNATSVFASFAPCDHPRYVVLVMVPDSGYGADVAAPAVRAEDEAAVLKLIAERGGSIRRDEEQRTAPSSSFTAAASAMRSWNSAGTLGA